ncbi:hypothetical protein N320_12401 [Buceros rhinoceros silvestris]|uniref:Uncharacterized protein n=1 Tax=Buceros rhinoceros silvestris TaxID=175836 RepID=A0A091H0H5_BUCRH|nr:hypothetical protein N320_12401 [Buceros rhinoceros silvestris]
MQIPCVCEVKASHFLPRSHLPPQTCKPQLMGKHAGPHKALSVLIAKS